MIENAVSNLLQGAKKNDLIQYSRISKLYHKMSL